MRDKILTETITEYKYRLLLVCAEDLEKGNFGNDLLYQYTVNISEQIYTYKNTAEISENLKQKQKLSERRKQILFALIGVLTFVLFIGVLTDNI